MDEETLISLWPAMLATEDTLNLTRSLSEARQERALLLDQIDQRIASLERQVSQREGILAPLRESDLSAVALRFWPKVRIVDDEDSCWTYTGYTRDRRAEEYGSFNTGARTELAHRVAFQLVHPGEPMPAVVMHSCDNPPCCRPKHLVGGTQADNIADATRKKRMRGKGLQYGEHNDASVLTETIVLEGRRRYRLGESVSAIARDLDVAQGTLQGALSGKTWSHLNVIEPPIEGRRSGTRFTESDIRAIRADYARRLGENPPRGLHGRLCEEIARRHGGMTAANINAIVRRKSWAHVE